MAYWHETCFISNLPIIGDGEVVALKTNTESDIELFLEYPYFDIVSFAKGYLSPYGELENITSKHIENRLRYKKFNTEKGFIIFCYADLWTKIVNKSKEFFHEVIEDIKEINPNIKLSEFQIEIKYVSVFMSRARAGFPANLKRGSQDLDTRCRKFIAELTLEKIKEIENYI